MVFGDIDQPFDAVAQKGVDQLAALSCRPPVSAIIRVIAALRHRLLDALHDEQIRQAARLRWSPAASEIAPVISPTSPDLFDRIIRAAFEGTKPSSAIAASTASRVSLATGASPFSTRLTVFAETSGQASNVVDRRQDRLLPKRSIL